MNSETNEPPSRSRQEDDIESMMSPVRASQENLNETIVNKLWPQVSERQWNDWRWQMANRLRSPERLGDVLGLSPYQVSRLRKLVVNYPFAVTPYYFSLIDWLDESDPVRRQSLPDMREIEMRMVGCQDPLEEEADMPVHNLVHRYPDRVLAIVTNTCSMYCRHCTRKRIWKSGEYACSWPDLEKMVAYIRETKAVREVIISGGDPLTMNLDLLNRFLCALRAIPHLEVIRIGTRVPVVLPMRIDDGLVAMLKQHRPIWINTQFNHPQEITPEARAAVDKLLCAGIPVSNQTVLLKGVNDDFETMLKLNHGLQKIMVRPYYLFQCDPVEGVEHFRTNVFKGMEIMEKMRGATGGLCIPTFVVDAPGGGGKIPLQPFYMLSASSQEIILRNYEGMIVRYDNPQEPDTVKKGLNAKVPRFSAVAAVPDKTIHPEKSARMVRRRTRGNVLGAC